MGGHGPRHLVTRRGEHEPNVTAVADGRGQPRRSAPAGPEDEDVDASNPTLAKPGEDPCFVGVAGDDEEDRPVVVPPQSASGGDGRSFDGRKRAERADHDDHGGDRRGRHDRERAVASTRGAAGGIAPAGQPPGAEGEDDGEGHEDDALGVEDRERQGGGGAGDHADPTDQQAGREVEGRGHRTSQDPGGQSRDDAPHHHRPRGRNGEEVGRHRRQGDPAEHGEQHRGHTRLGGQRHGQWGGDAPGFQARGQQGDAGARRDRQEKSDGPGEERVDEHERGDRERQDADRGGRPAERRGAEGEPGHRDGTQHRRLPSREDAEAHQDRGAQREPSSEREPSQQRGGDGQDEGDVLTGDRQQVGEASGPEVVDLGLGLFAVVAQHQPGEEGAATLRQRGRPVDERSPELVGEPGDRTSGAGVASCGHDEGAPDVAEGEELPTRRADGPAPSVHLHVLARQHRAEHGGGVRGGRGRNPTAVVEA